MYQSFQSRLLYFHWKDNQAENNQSNKRKRNHATWEEANQKKKRTINDATYQEIIKKTHELIQYLIISICDILIQCPILSSSIILLKENALVSLTGCEAVIVLKALNALVCLTLNALVSLTECGFGRSSRGSMRNHYLAQQSRQPRFQQGAMRGRRGKNNFKSTITTLNT